MIIGEVMACHDRSRGSEYIGAIEWPSSSSSSLVYTEMQRDTDMKLLQ